MVPKPTIRYLGITFDRGITFRSHIRKATEKASKAANALRGLLPRLDELSDGKRRLLASVAQSVILYAAPVWAPVLQYKCSEAILSLLNRKLAIGICRGYRAIPTPTAEVLANLTPIKLLIEERVITFGKTMAERREAKANTIVKWQARREEISGNTWLKRTMPNIISWINRAHGNFDFHVTQCLSGHGCYQAYLLRRRRTTTEICSHFMGEDNVEHTIFGCPRWMEYRETAEHSLGLPLTVIASQIPCCATTIAGTSSLA